MSGTPSYRLFFVVRSIIIGNVCIVIVRIAVCLCCILIVLYIGQLTIFKFLLLVTVVAEGLILRVTLAVTLDDGTKISIAFVDVLLELDLGTVFCQNSDIQTQGLKLF